MLAPCSGSKNGWLPIATSGFALAISPSCIPDVALARIRAHGFRKHAYPGLELGRHLVESAPTGAASCAAASIAPWPRPPPCARPPQQWPDRALPGSADRLRPAARAHPARQSAALISACSLARGGDRSSRQV